jgi:hypothetical protein
MWLSIIRDLTHVTQCVWTPRGSLVLITIHTALSDLRTNVLSLDVYDMATLEQEKNTTTVGAKLQDPPRAIYGWKLHASMAG